MNAFLKTLACESEDAIAEVEGNPEEITIFTDATETELEEVVADMAEDVEKAEEQSDAAEKMIDVIESLESKIVALREGRERGELLNAVAAKIYSNTVVTSLESRGFPRAIFADEVNKMTTSFESVSAYDYSVEAEEKTTSLLDKVKGMLKRALNAFITFWKDVANRVRGLNKSMVALGNKVIERSRTIKGVAKSDVKISGSGLELLGADAVKALETIKAAGKDVANNEATLGTILKATNVATVSGADRGEHVKAIEAISAKLKTEISLTADGALKLKWADENNGKFVVDGKAGKGEDELAVLNQDAIVKIGKALVETGTALDLSEVDQKSLIGKLEASINELLSKLGEAEQPNSAALLKTFNASLNALRTGRVALNSHAQKVAKQAYRYATMSIVRHTDEAGAAAARSKAAAKEAEKAAKEEKKEEAK